MKVLNKRRHVIPSDAVYIGRGSKWGNPFVIGKNGDRQHCIELYETYVRSNPVLMAALPELKDKVLVCYCAPLPCHGDVLIRLVGEIEDNRKDE